MQKNLSSSKGFAHIAILVIAVLAVIAGSGVYVYKHNHDKQQSSKASSRATDTTKDTGTSGSKATPTDPYAGWKTATLSSPQLSFRYPVDWTITTSTDGENIEVKTSATGGHYFDLSLIAGKAADVNLNFLGTAPGTTLSGFTVDGRAMYAVAQTAGTDGAVTGIGLATTTGSASTSFGVIDSQKAHNVTMVAALTPTNQTTSDNGAEYSLDAYKAEPLYSDILKVFESLNGTLPQ
ncbi:hypothetical protein [Streptomyces sp. NPDC050548]|uniref:hypothetical protein n=1 Tax=Streptomyces sp. NPDC050548 TaxID=3365629 RepID=UPI0037B016EB